MTTWSPQQSEALSKAGAWLRIKYAPSFYLAGVAGSGKSTLAIHIASHCRGRVAFAAFTGKAARVMRDKGCTGAQTIHSLIYDTSVDAETGEVTSTLKDAAELEKFALIVIDEVSMVDEALGNDLLSFNIPIIVLGDPEQLPPVSGGGFFTSRTPDYVLSEVHRQAAESPIIRLATEVREGQFSPRAIDLPGLSVVADRSRLDPALVTDADVVLVGRNDTRQKYNRRLRQLAGRTGAFPAKGETVICLRNDRQLRIFNGELFTVERAQVNQESVSLRIVDAERDQPPIKVKVLKDFFEDDVAAAKLPFKELHGTQQFTFGYAITCHKAQGSQWPNVCVFDESQTFREDARRWLYTAITRAANHLTLVL
jgi:exodeoxyribonuclease-5